MENTAPYFFRPVPADATREEVEVVGGSVGWNQLINKANFPASDTIYTNNDDGTVTANGTPETAATFRVLEVSAGTYDNGHKFLLLTGLTGTGSASTYEVMAVNFKSSNVDVYGAGKVFSYDGINATAYIQLVVRAGYTASGLKFAPMLIDLTAMLGSTIADYIATLESGAAGAGVAFYQKYFGSDYKPYSTPTIKSVEGVSGHKLVGFNQFNGSDFTIYNAYCRQGTEGYEWASSSDSRSIAVKCLPNATYYIHMNGLAPSIFRCGSITSETLPANPVGTYTVPLEKAYVQSATGAMSYVTGETAKWLVIQIGSSFFTNNQVAGNLCVNISDPARNGQYEPYTVHTYAMDDSVTLRGIPKIADGEMYFDGDVYLPDGTVNRRFDVVDLGTLDWTRNTDGTYAYFISGRYDPALGTTGLLNTVCGKYVSIANRNATDFRSADYDKCICLGRQSGYTRIQIQDSAYTDADAFTTAMSGVYMVYEKATPTTESATPYTTPQICAPGGTEEWVTTGLVPVGHRTWYPTDQVGKLDGLPADFSTLIAPTEKTTTASRAYSIGDYFILNNILYKVVSAIASGGTITPGTNATATTIMAEIAAL